MPKLAKNTNHRQIARADMDAEDWSDAWAQLRQMLRAAVARGNPGEASAADHGLRALRNLESMAKQNARERIRAAGGAV